MSAEPSPVRGSLGALAVLAPLALGATVVGRGYLLEALTPLLVGQAALLAVVAWVLRDRARVTLLEGGLLLLIVAAPLGLFALGSPRFTGHEVVPELDLWVAGLAALRISVGLACAAAVALAARGSAGWGAGCAVAALTVAMLVGIPLAWADDRFDLEVGLPAAAVLGLLAYVWITTGRDFSDPAGRTRARVARTLIAFALAAAFVHDGVEDSWSGFQCHRSWRGPTAPEPYGFGWVWLLDALAARERLLLQLLIPLGLLLRTWIGRPSRPAESSSSALVSATAAALLVPAVLFVPYALSRGLDRGVAKAHVHAPGGALSIPPTVELAGVGQPPARRSLPWPFTTTLSGRSTRYLRGELADATCDPVVLSRIEVEPGLDLATPERLPDKRGATPALHVADGTPWQEVVSALERHAGGDTRLDFCMPMPSPPDQP